MARKVALKPEQMKAGVRYIVTGVSKVHKGLESVGDPILLRKGQLISVHGPLTSMHHITSVKLDEKHLKLISAIKYEQSIDCIRLIDEIGGM